MAGPLMSIAQLAEHLGVPRTWVRDKVTAGALPTTRIGKHVRFTQEQVDAIVEAGERLALSGPLARARDLRRTT